MRVRRSSRSASAVSIVNDRIAVESADFSARTDMWLLTLVVWRTPCEVRLHTGRVSEPERIARRGLRRSAHPPYAQPAGGRRRSLLENPQIAGIEDLRVANLPEPSATDMADRNCWSRRCSAELPEAEGRC